MDDWTYDGLALGVRAALDQLVVGLGRAARAFVQCNGWTHFGHARGDDHAREALGRSGRWLRDLAALGSAFECLPGIEAALAGRDGQAPLGQVAALAISRIASVESIAAWLDLARRVPVRTLKDHIRKAREAGSTWPPGTEPEQIVGAASGPSVDTASRATAGAVTDTTAGTGQNTTARADFREADPTNDICTATLQTPPTARVLFNDARLLHSAVCGRDETAASLVEALIAEANAGPVPVDADIRKQPGLSTTDYWRQVETDVYFSTDNWRHLRRQPAPCEQAALDTLDEVDDVMTRAGTGSPAELQEQLLTLVALDDRLQRELGRLLVILGHGRAWSALDFTGLGHYAEQRLGMSRTATRNRVTVARELLERPLLRQAYEDGRLGFEAVVLVLRVLRRGVGSAGDAAEQAWVSHASRTTLKRLRDEARVLCGSRRLDDERKPARPLGTREWHASLRMAPGNFRGRLRDLATQAALENRSSTLRLKLPRQLADDFFGAIESRRQLLNAAIASENASADPSTDPSARPGAQLFSSASQIPMTAAQLFSSTGQVDHVGSALIRKDSDAGVTGPQSFSCNGQPDQNGGQLFSSSDQPGPSQACGLSTGAPASPVPWKNDSVALQTARLLAQRGGRLPLWVGLLALLEDYIETWDDPQAVPRREGQAVYIRDGWRCAAPGCTSRQQLESHHIVYRSRGGAVKDEANQICLCRFHHQQGEHGELASCHGTAPLGVAWRLGHPSVGIWFQNEMRI